MTDLVQLQNPRSQEWILIDRDKGQILGLSDTRVPGVPVANVDKKPLSDAEKIAGWAGWPSEAEYEGHGEHVPPPNNVPAPFSR